MSYISGGTTRGAYLNSRNTPNVMQVPCRAHVVAGGAASDSVALHRCEIAFPAEIGTSLIKNDGRYWVRGSELGDRGRIEVKEDQGSADMHAASCGP